MIICKDTKIEALTLKSEVSDSKMASTNHNYNQTDKKAQYWQKAIEKNPHLSRIGQPWSNKEEDTLLKRISEGKSVDEISIELERAKGGITSRLKNIASGLILTGTSIEEAARITSLSEQALTQSIKAQKAKVEKEMGIGKSESSRPVLDFSKHTQSTQSDDLKELLSLTRDIHKMLKGIVCEYVEPSVPVPSAKVTVEVASFDPFETTHEPVFEKVKSVIDYFKTPVLLSVPKPTQPTKPTKKIVKSHCLFQDD